MSKISTLLIAGLLMACSGQSSDTAQEQSTPSRSTARKPALSAFDKDRQFLKQHHDDLVELEMGNARALICPAYQGRVMTTTADGRASYGWLNYDLIRSGKFQPHMNAFGGEDRLWLGPEGGQYALFFKPGDPFDSEHWQTPAAFDTQPFSLMKRTPTSATFGRDVSLINYAGTRFNMRIERTVLLLDKPTIRQLLETDVDSLSVVGISSLNSIKNRGTQPWTLETGMPSIWILSMMNASPTTTVIVPYRPGTGPPVNDAYFGKVPANRLHIGKTAALFKADAKYRSKIGVSPNRATNWLGSYDSATSTLTLVTYSFNLANRQYVNSAWEHQKKPYTGDVINAYNDGPMKPGQPQMGAFYELESSSPAAQLTPGAQLRHRHTTLHVQGSEQQLSQLAKRLLLTDLSRLKSG